MASPLAICSLSALALNELRRLGIWHFTPSRPAARSDIKRIAQRAFTVISTNLISLAAMFVVIGIASTAGVEVAAAFGTVFRIEQFGLITLNGIVLALVPMAAASIRDGDDSKLRQAVLSALGLIFIASALIGIGLSLGSTAISKVFGLPPLATGLLHMWLHFVSVALFFQGVTLAITALLQIRKAKLAMYFSMIRLYGIMLPLLWFLSRRSIWAIYPALSLTYILSGTVLLLCLGRYAWRKRAAVQTPEAKGQFSTLS